MLLHSICLIFCLKEVNKGSEAIVQETERWGGGSDDGFEVGNFQGEKLVSLIN